MIRRPPRSTHCISSAASDVYKRQILKDFLPDAHSILSKGRRSVVASPVGTKTPDIAESSGFKVVDRHEVYVHRSLTREILVLEAN